MKFLNWFGKKSEGAPPENKQPAGQVEVVIPLDEAPEAIAEHLIAGDLPKTFIDEIDISTDSGTTRLLACLMLRRHQASLERDEIVRFTKRNQATLKRGGLDLYKAISSVSDKVEGGKAIGQFFEYFITQVNHALAGHPDKINVKSDRLLWLCYALALKVSSGLPYREAFCILSKPQHRDRISELSLTFMLKDWAEAMGTRDFPDSEYLMLIAECAMLSEDPNALAASYKILTRLKPARDVTAWSDLIRRVAAKLDRVGRLDDGGRQFLRTMAQRFQEEVADDDL